MKTGTSMYRSIALDLAQRIINGEFSAKIPGRTVLSSSYNVSSETIRKAIALLKLKNVVSVSQGKEVAVISIQNAYTFIEHYKNTESMFSLRQQVDTLLCQKREIDTKLEEILAEIINYADKLRNLSPYNPVEIQVQESDSMAGHSVADVQLWQHTGATIVAVRRGEHMLISPGPNEKIVPGDRIVIVGDSGVLERTINFLGQKKEDTLSL